MERRVIIILSLFIVTTMIYTSTAEPCTAELCQTEEKCETVNNDGECGNSGEVCCSLVRTEYRTKCRQWGGECTTSYCPPHLTQYGAQDCYYDTKCCVWVK